jgi:hypothetical protein
MVNTPPLPVSRFRPILGHPPAVRAGLPIHEATALHTPMPALRVIHDCH